MSINRRMFIKASVALSSLSSMTGLSAMLVKVAHAGETHPSPHTEPFNFELLKRKASSLATEPWHDPAVVLPATLREITPQRYNAIRTNPAQSLWHDDANRQLDVQFFHMGMGFTSPVMMYSVDNTTGQATPIHFNTDQFIYGDSHVETAQLKDRSDLGFAGFRVFKAPHLDQRDIVSFLGASYFRAVDDTYQYGLSARAVAINTFSNHEEFPSFTAFWFDAPKKDSTTFTVYALLEGVSLTGAYKFTIDCQTQRVVMHIEHTLYARQDIAQLGIAPMTSMFSTGTNDHRIADTYHPQIHDSDRLAMWSGNGEWITRPLNNPRYVRFNSFVDEDPKGFGLLQLDHDFKSYQDVIGWYNKRPSLWVEPTNDWGKGHIALMELPTNGETFDNIVCFWQPDQPLKKGQSYHCAYKLYWSAQPPVQSHLSRIVATRVGSGGFPEGWAPGEHYPSVWCRRFAIDFTAAELKDYAKTGLTPDITLSSGHNKQIEVLYVEPLDCYRILFDWYPDNDSVAPVDMRLFVKCQDKTLSETWLYQYMPPPAAQRKYSNDRN